MIFLYCENSLLEYYKIFLIFDYKICNLYYYVRSTFMASKAKRAQFKQWKTNSDIPIPKRTLVRLKKACDVEKQQNLCGLTLPVTAPVPVDLYPILSEVTDQTDTDIMCTLNDRTTVNVSQQPTVHDAATETLEYVANEELAHLGETTASINVN